MSFFTRRKTIATGAPAFTALAAASTTGVDQSFAQQPKPEQPTSNPTGKLQGKVAVITGAARGIGRATALAMAREGADKDLFPELVVLE